MVFNRNDMLNELRQRECRVIFTKVDGEQRDMICTLNEDAIPEQHRPKGGGKEYSEAVIRAFDVNKQQFRSFRVENVISFS